MQIGPNKLLVNIEVNAADQLDTDQLEALTDRIKNRIQEKVSSVKIVQVGFEGPE